MFEQSTLILTAINAVLAYSFFAVLVAGQLSLAQIGCASVALFTAAYFVDGFSSVGVLPPLVVAIPIGMAVGAAAALLIGLPVMRLRGVFLAIATLGFAEIARIVLTNMEWTGGALGTRVDKIITLPIAWGIVAVVAYWFLRMRRSRLGRALAAVREDELAALAMGVDVVRYRLFSYVTAGALAGLYGVMYGYFVRAFEPNDFDFPRAVDGLMSGVVGGTSNFFGPILGSTFFEAIPEVLRGLGVQVGWVRPFVSGAVLLIIIIFLPGGLASLIPTKRRLQEPSEATGTAAPAALALDPANGATAAIGTEAIGATDDDVLLDVRGWSKDYGGVHAVRDVTMQIRRGEIVGLIGPNGAGKTTLVNMISGLVAPSSGSGRVLGAPVVGRTRADVVARRGLSRTFQHSKLFPRLDALENVLVGCHRLSRPTFLRRLLFLPSAARDERVDIDRAWAQLARVGLADRAAVKASALSYGDQRRLEIARALASEPQLLILDEPAAGMNHVEAAALGALIGSLADTGTTVLLIEHNVRMVLRTCSRVIVLNFGQVIAAGTPDEIAADETVVDAYLGSESAS